MQKMMSRGYAIAAQKYKKVFVIEKLQKNLAAHVAAYEEAFAAYKELAADALKKSKNAALRALSKVLAELEEQTPDSEPIDLYVPNIAANLSRPISYASHYRRAIAQLTNCLAEEIELDDVAYTCFIEDDWAWKEQFTTISEGYASVRSSKR